MFLPPGIYQNISDVCPELMLHMVVKSVKPPSQYQTAKRMLEGKLLKGKLGRRGHLRYLYSSGDKDRIIDYVKSKKRYDTKGLFLLEHSHNYLTIMASFKVACRLRSSLHYSLLDIR